MGDRPQRRPAVISIGKELQEWRFRQAWLTGYPVRFRKAADRNLFQYNRFVLYKPNTFVKNKTGQKCWVLGDSVTGAIWCKNTIRNDLIKWTRQLTHFWELYRLILVCRIDSCNHKGPSDWGSTKTNSIYTDEFNALLVAAKMEGLTSSSTVKDIKKLYATNAQT